MESKLYNSYIQGEICDIKAWYRPGNPPAETPSIFKDIECDTLYISSKQVPSATMIRGSSNYSVKSQRDILHSGGFPLMVKKGGEENYTPLTPLYNKMQNSPSVISGLTNDNLSGVSTMTSQSRSLAELDEEISLKQIPVDLGPEKDLKVKIRYVDPWKAHGLVQWQHRVGKTPTKLIVWNSDVLRISDPLPPSTLGKRWNSKSNNTIRFQKIRDVGVKTYVLLYKTHWGKALMELRRSTCPSKRTWANTMIKRIKSFLKGDSDPIYSKKVTISLGRKGTPSLQESRAFRFLELLKTVDGIFTERYLCRTEEAWTWHKYDMYTLWNINWLLTDEFFDGEISEQEIELTSSYQALKRLRGDLKYMGHTKCTKSKLDEYGKTVPIWLRSYFLVFKGIKTDDDIEYIESVNYISQTRGCGTPPPIVTLQSKIKFIKTVSSEPAPDSAIRNRFIREVITRVISDIPPHHFTGLSTKAKITVTSSATFENLKKEYGTIQSIQDLLLNGVTGIPAKIIDLNTGKFVEHINMDDGPATYIFWRCLEYVMATPLDELKVAYVTMVKEPGKGRTVTKARACLKIVLDVISKICAYPLSKGISSSSSGMKRSNQGWNFFKDMHTDNLKELVYGPHEKEIIEESMDSIAMRETYRPLFASSTDYEEATDSFDHKVGRILSNAWMIHCGIPRILRGIVNATCYNSRKIVFSSRGILNTIGYKHSETERFVILRKGVLMGDPLTKVILHLLNVCVRYAAKEIINFTFVRNISKSAEQIINEGKKVLKS
jgi:hypothetical protein